LPDHDCSADLVVDIGPVAGIHLAPPAAHALVFHVAAPTAAAVMAFPALQADLLSPAKAQVTKRWQASSKQDIKNVADMAEAGRATHHKDTLHHAERRALSFGTNDFKSDDRDRQIDLLVQVLPDDCIKHLLNKDLDSLNNMEPKTVLSLFGLKSRANARGWSAQSISIFRSTFCKVLMWLDENDYPVKPDRTLVPIKDATKIFLGTIIWNHKLKTVFYHPLRLTQGCH